MGDGCEKTVRENSGQRRIGVGDGGQGCQRAAVTRCGQCAMIERKYVSTPSNI